MAKKLIDFDKAKIKIVNQYLDGLKNEDFDSYNMVNYIKHLEYNKGYTKALERVQDLIILRRKQGATCSGNYWVVDSLELTNAISKLMEDNNDTRRI